MYFEAIYVEINTLCIFILAFLIVRLSVNMDQRKSNIDFRNTMAAVIVIMAIDIVSLLIDGKNGEIYRVLNYLLNGMMFIQGSVIALLWLRYVISKFRIKIKLTLKGRIILYMPVVILAFFVIASIWTGWIYTIDSDNFYQRGPLHILVLIMAAIYYVISFAMVIFKIHNAKNRIDRMKAAIMTTFFFFPTLGGLLSSFSPKFPIMWPCATLSLLMIFVNYKESEISTDSLTGLNNRRQFDRRIVDMTKNLNSEESLFLFLMDINDFKGINDNYGHYEGDRALVESAKVLKRVLCETSLFLARYGGDEFAILGFLEGTSEANDLKKKIQRHFTDSNIQVVREYDINMGVGYYEFGEGHAETIQELIIGADQSLYEDKARLKKVIASVSLSSDRFF